MRGDDKHFLAVKDSMCGFTQNWRGVLLKLRSRGVNVPEPATGDEAMDFLGRAGMNLRGDAPAMLLGIQDL